MKTVLRMILCVLMVCAALTMAMLTLLGFSPKRAGAERQESEGYYILGEAGGNVAVFTSSDRRNPVTVTNIEMATLREHDRAEIRAGLIYGAESELLQVLEDLGS